MKISRSQSSHAGKRLPDLRCAGLCLILLFAGPAQSRTTAAPPVSSASAPLDTLQEASEPVPIDPRYAGGDIEISRKVLPDVQATTVPTGRTPDRTPRLDDPQAGAWKFHLARQAALGGNPDLVRTNLRDAVLAAPGESRYAWWQSLQAVKGMDAATLVQVLPVSIRAIIDSPVARGSAVVRAHQFALLATGVFWTLLVAALYLVWWPHLAHDLGAIFVRDRRHNLRNKLPLVLPFAFLMLRPGWLGFLALMSVPLLIQTRGKARALLASTWLAAVALAFPTWPLLQQAVPAIDPGSEVTLLQRAGTLPPSRVLIDRLESALKEAVDPGRRTRLQTVLAIQEARRGRFTQSDRLFSDILQREPTHFPAQVGLANNTYYRGRLDQAADGYRRAAEAHPNRGEIPYNEAQVYFKKLFVPEATEALDRARDLGFAAARAAGGREIRRDGYSPVVYPALTTAEMTAACAFEAGNYPPEVTFSAWQHLLGAPPVPLYMLLSAPLLLAFLLVWKWSRQNDPRCCENCGVPVCITCSRVRDTAWLCPGCGETADRARSDHVLGTLLKNRSRTEGMAYSARVVRLGRMLPGAGHLATDHVLSGWARLSLLSLGLIVALTGWSFDLGAAWATPGLLLPSEAIHPVWLPLPVALWSGFGALPILIGAALTVLALLIGLFDGPGLRRGIPDRYSMAPQIEVKNPAASVDEPFEAPTGRVHVTSRSR